VALYTEEPAIWAPAVRALQAPRVGVALQPEGTAVIVQQVGDWEVDHLVILSHVARWLHISQSIKAMIVIEGLQGKPAAEVCTEPQIGQAQYYQWHDQFLAHAPKAFEVHKHSHEESRLEQENVRSKKLVGKLLLYRKKRGAVFG
jgi:hypothetical protein